MDDQTGKRFAVFTAAAELSTWAVDMAATQVGLSSMQASLHAFPAFLHMRHPPEPIASEHRWMAV